MIAKVTQWIAVVCEAFCEANRRRRRRTGAVSVCRRRGEAAVFMQLNHSNAEKVAGAAAHGPQDRHGPGQRGANGR